MIRFDQRNFDVQATERVYRKVIHPSKTLHLVDKDGIPLRTPNTTSLSRLHSTYVLSPRGVPTRKTNHSYSGQLAQGKMQTLVNTMETHSHPEFTSYMAMLNYNNSSGLSSAGSSRPPMPVTPKKRSFGSGPPRSVKSVPTKSASSQRTRYLTSAATTDQMSQDTDGEKSNDSPQGKRLEKEWSAKSQCRALKRSSEIVSHRVDRMYFMTGNKLKIASKYHVEEDELQHLRSLSQARASSRASRSSRKGDVYHPDGSSRSSTKTGHAENGGFMGHMNGVAGKDDGQRGRHGGQKENKEPKPIVSQKTLTPKPSNRKSPLQGWAGGDNGEKEDSVENEMVSRKSLHDEKSVLDGDEQERGVTGNVDETGSANDVDETDQVAPEYGENDNTGDETVKGETNALDNSEHPVNGDVDISGENQETCQADTEEVPTEVEASHGDATKTANNESKENSNEENQGEESVHKSDTIVSDKDQVEVKTEENLEST